MKFASKLTLTVTLVSAIFLPLLGAILYFQARGDLEASIIANQRELAEHTLAEIERTMQGALLDIRLISEDEFLQQYFEDIDRQIATDVSHREALFEELVERQSLSGPWLMLFTAGKDGLINISTREELANRPVGEFTVSRFAYSAALQGNVYVSDLVMSGVTGELAIVFAAPIPDIATNAVNGTMIGHFDWSAVLRLLDEIDRNNQVFLFNRDGTIIGAQAPNRNLILQGDLGEIAAVAPLVRARRPGSLTLTLDERTGPVLATVAFEGQSDDYPGRGWGVLLGVPVDRAFAPIDRLTRNTIGVAAACMLAVAVLFYFIGHHLAKPIEALTRGVQRLASGDLQAKVPVTGDGELGTLGYAFNKMTDDLRRTTLSRDHVEGIFRTMKDSLFVLAPDGTITLVNQAALDLLGYAKSELLQAPFEKVLPDRPWLDTLIATGFTGTVEQHLRAKNDDLVPVLLSTSVMRNDSAVIQNVVCTALDITERIRAEEAVKRKSEELQRTNAELEQFAYVASHDLKAPLRAVSQLSSWMDEDLSEHLDQENRNRLRLMRERVIRMDQLIDGLLAYSRAGRVTGEVRERVPLKPLLEELVHEVSLPVGYHVEIKEPLPRLLADPLHLKQIFQNLITNAVFHHDHAESGHVQIQAAKNGRFWRIEIADDGPGIPPEDRKRVFEMFTSLHPERDKPHTGIGLTIVRKLVHSYGGEIDVVENQPRGARFRVWWPF